MRFFIHIFVFLIACCVEKYILPDISYNDVKNFYTKSLNVIRSKNIPLPEGFLLNPPSAQAAPTNYTIVSVGTYSELPENQ